MPITFYIPGPLRRHTSGLHKVDVDVAGSTVADALASLWQAYPGLRDRILTEQGEVRQHVNVFVGEENIRYCGGFGAPVVSGSSITLVPAVSGGAGNLARRIASPDPTRKLRFVAKIVRILIPCGEKMQGCVGSSFLFATRNQDVAHLDSFRRKDGNIRRILIPFPRKEQKWRTS